MDEFFQDLREIQKKERNLSSLSPVGEDFYQQISSYFNKLMERIDNNPFSFESYLLRDAQRIVVEICERREYKITNSAVMNAQRSHHLFKNSKRDSRPKVPINSTPEEQKLYMELYSSLTAYREEMRSPLLSYSHKKEIKSSSFSSPRSSYSVDNEGSSDKDNVSESIVSETDYPESPLPKEIGKEPTSRSPPLDEIPPDIQDEIYRQFGREPSKQNSKHPSAGSAVETATDSSSKARGSENGNNVPGDFEAVSGPKTVHLEDEPVLDNAKDTGSKISTEVLMILEELPSIMGVDRKVYGPFHPGDIITMPEPNARILIKNQKGKSIQRYK
ncbi:hypothetical protein [Methanobacterium sp. BAmetb5]|uniref:DNA replication complex subunit Gins51 n=1 Tax=Methanobacterium sp. BAmetb5 TaxID=2025351 RepID=UPI000E9EB38C|nr:hypothetical protein [Methanobacterium sp. BAmetb5]AXV40249.1 MAG: hypothetical protein CIT02_07920 [Methanobacterium sp. BAmetb5]